MNAIINLIEETDKLDRSSQKNFEPAIREIAGTEAIIQALLNVALDLQNQLSNLIILQFEFVLPPEEERPEIKRDDGSSQEITDYTINIGPVNIYSIADVLGDTFSKFQTQTESIAGIYAPYAFSEAPLTVAPELIETIAKESEKVVQTGTAHGTRFHGTRAEETEKKLSIYDDTFFLRNETLNTNLKKSALIINKLKTIRDRMTGISVERESVYARASVPEILVPAGQKNRAISDLLKNNKEVQNHVKDISELMEMISTSLHTKISEIHQVTDIFSLKNISVSSLPGLTKSEQRPVIYPDQRMIEIPTFMPTQKVSMPNDETVINATKISNAIAQEKMTISSLRKSLLETQEGSQPLFAPSVSNAFETISDYITIATDIDNRVREMIGQSGQVANNIITPLNLLMTVPMTVSNGGDALSLNRIVPGGNGGIAAKGQMMNIVHSIAATEVLQKVGSSAIKDINVAVPPSGTSGSSATAMPRTMGNILQILSGSGMETSAASHAGSNAVHLQNTFNIVVNIKGGRDEGELRDLGRKIGLILSDEIKRYGGIR